MARIFKYQDQTWEDPGENFSNEDVKKHLTQFFPELAQASIETKDMDGGVTEVRFVKRAGTKGVQSLSAVQVDLRDVIRQAAEQVFGGDERALLQDWLRRATDPQIVTLNLRYTTGKAKTGGVCPQCGSGKLKVINVTGYDDLVCGHCGYTVNSDVYGEQTAEALGC